MNYIKDKRIILDKTRFNVTATYHDPCNYGRNAERRFGHGYFQEPRWILDQCLENWVELYPTDRHQFCCGGGGGALASGYQQERLYYGRKKMTQISASGAEMVVMPCHSCHGQIESLKMEYGQPDLEVKYLWELVADCLVI